MGWPGNGSLLLVPLIMVVGLFVALTGLSYFWGHFGHSSEREVSSPFECGFDPADISRYPFSVRFFLLLVLFMMFDAELVLLMNMPFLSSCGYYGVGIQAWAMVVLLGLGLFEEWRRGMLSWKG